MRLMLVVLLSASLHAAYNPFFNEKPAKPKQPVQKPQPKTTVKPRVSPFNDIDIAYFGFIQTNKGQFALLKMQERTFAIAQGSNLYHGSNKINIVKISSNAIVLKAAGRHKTVYFSQKER